MKKLVLTLTLATAFTAHASTQNALQAGGIRNWILDKAAEHPKVSASVWAGAVTAGCFASAFSIAFLLENTETGQYLLD